MKELQSNDSKSLLNSSSAGNSGRASSYAVPGYVICEVVYASQFRPIDVVIQRGYSINDQSIKVICKGSGQVSEVANKRIEHEYETLKYLYEKASPHNHAKYGNDSEFFIRNSQHSFIPRPIEIVKDKGVWTLVVEDVGGCSLRKFEELFAKNTTTPDGSQENKQPGKRKLPLETILSISVQIVEALKMTITAGIIHKDINPDNIIVVTLPENQLAVQLIDFNLACLSASDTSSNDTNVLLGTVAYIAPEQTGRLQRNADFRSDFYSLDVMDYIHAHIAIEIESPSTLDPSIPKFVSSVVEKLVKKSPDARYQSIYGLKYDLSECLRAIDKYRREHGISSDSVLSDSEVISAFELSNLHTVGSKDCSKSLSIPKGKLYGRNIEQDLLISLIEESLNNDNAKTDFILFQVAGAFTKNGPPFQGIIEALTQLVGVLLSSEAELLDLYFQKIKSELLVEHLRLKTVIPDLSLMFEPSCALADNVSVTIYPELAQDLKKFMEVVTSVDKSIALCLKNVELADNESIEFLASLDCKLLVILASYQNEKSSECKLCLTLSSMNRKCTSIFLKPLNFTEIKLLLEETITPSIPPIQGLAALVERKTFGTPAYIHQFLQKAEAIGLLWFEEDESECGWNWDLLSLDKNIEVSESVLKDMSKRIRSLTVESKSVLEAAVCIGEVFDVRLLSNLLNQKVSTTLNLIWDFMKAGFIKPVPRSEGFYILKDDSVTNESDSTVAEYKFTYSAIQVEIYESMGPEKQELNHLKIARTLYEFLQCGKLVKDERLICRHYNRAINIHDDPTEKKLVANLNLKASERALDEYDFDSSKYFIFHGIKILDDLRTKYNEKEDIDFFKLNLCLVKCMIVDGNFEDARFLLKSIEDKTKSEVCKSRIFYQLRYIDAVAGKYSSVVDESVRYLERLGVNTPKGDLKQAVSPLLESCCATLLKGKVELLRQAKMASEEVNIVQGILSLAAFASRMISSKLLSAFFITTGCLMSLSSGFGEFSGALWAALPSIHFDIHFEVVFSMIEISQEVSASIDDFLSIKPSELEMIYKLFSGQLLKVSSVQRTDILSNMIQNAKRCGNLLTLNTVSQIIPICCIISGRPSSFLKKLLTQHHEVLYMAHSHSLSILENFSNWFDMFLEGEYTASNISSMLNILSAIVYEQADLKVLTQNCSKSEECFLMEKCVDYALADALQLTLEFEVSGTQRKPEIESKLNSKLEQLSSLVAQGVKDACGKKLLVAAEIERVLGNSIGAVKNYEAAMQEFKTSNAPMFEALTMEKLAAFWYSAGMLQMSKMCFIEAGNKWEAYGSNGKRLQILKKLKLLFGSSESLKLDTSINLTSSPLVSPAILPGLTSQRELTPSQSNSVTHTHSIPGSQQGNRDGRMDVDSNTLRKVTQSIQNETSLDSLLRKIMKFVMVNTGATKGVLVLNDSFLGLVVEGMAELLDGKEVTNVLQSHPVTNQVNGFRLPLSMIYYAYRTGKSIVLSDPPNDPTHGTDAYVKEFSPKSMMCCPIINQSNVEGVVYLENNLQGATFTPKRIEFIQSLMPMAAMYIKNAKLTKTNTALTKALNESENASNAPKYKIDAPVQRALDVLLNLKSRMISQGDPAAKQIDFIMKSLTSSDLFMSSIDEINDQHGRGIDKDTKNWIENSLLQKSTESPRYSELKKSDAMFVSANGTNGRRLTVINVLADESTRHPSDIMISTSTTVENQMEINAYLENAMSFDFDVFKLAELTDNQPLYHLSMHLLQYYGLIEHFNIDITVASSFFREVEANYRNLSYHNSFHAADVLQTVNLLLLSDPQMAQNFTKLEILAACIASAVHDVDHPGVNNNYLIQSSHPLAILYNDLSVLEYHHASKAFEIMQKPETNIFAKFSIDQKRDIRKQMINMVIATDMSQHFTYINKLKSKISATTLKLQEAADRALVLDMAIKCADLNNPTKSHELCKQWAFRIMEEFFQQGDRERLNGLNVSMFMDRKETSIPKCQIGFIDILVTPLFESWSQCIETDFTRICMQNIRMNREYWESILDKPECIPKFDPPQQQVLEKELFSTVGSPATLKKKRMSAQVGARPGKSFVNDTTIEAKFFKTDRQLKASSSSPSSAINQRFSPKNLPELPKSDLLDVPE
ncbi:hypothetical protein HDU83_001294 [Entophlyctis luteolus]|nr:hypothetical protein HDU83_001294 [Entophlyctis luteolus]